MIGILFKLNSTHADQIVFVSDCTYNSVAHEISAWVDAQDNLVKLLVNYSFSQNRNGLSKCGLF